jgi:hypothetical protein
MAVLPFVVQPRKNTEKVLIGNEEVGIIEIERKGYLTVAEKSFVESVTQGSDGVSSMVFLANKIASANKTTPEKAYAAITNAMSGETGTKLANVVIQNYAEELAEVTSKLSESMQRRQIAAATVLLKTRVASDWAIEDTMDLDPELLAEIASLYDQEEQRIPVAKKTPQEEAEEVVGKSKEENGDK